MLKKINVFGESKVDKVAVEYGIDTTAKIPIDPNFASLSDKGTIELFDGNYLDKIFEKQQNINDKLSENHVDTSLIEYKESFFTRFKNFIFKILHINK